ncbi:hypothetical protein TSOC_004069 [Tetrabaena socialis]|uniref:Uncharacterized protein n=1 Tax=Tetrabaena socialis TaxID=47790 RepID=A0A2J8A9W0_9CHLO|nr:hypothetical protein TSOC_004069 [Tetrabaena socialis]|eukprot:PNH09317.1 hypothetical protein TSOC_004069 [Tetrabaena socialis]
MTLPLQHWSPCRPGVASAPLLLLLQLLLVALPCAPAQNTTTQFATHLEMGEIISKPLEAGQNATYKPSSSSSSSTYAPSSSSSTISSSRYTSYGSSRGVATRAVIVGVVLVSTYALYSNHYYYTTRFYYNDYYDDCALRNITAERAGQGDYYIDPNAVAAIPNTVPYQSGSFDLIQFNNTLYNQTNGLVVDPAYCNSTYTGGAAAVRAAVLWLLAAVAAACCVLGWGPELL